jgi:hypothetical protein
MNSPCPGFSVTLLFVLDSPTEGDEWTEAEVVAILESSGKPSVSFIGGSLTVKDRIILETPSVNVVATCILFVWLIDGLWRAVEFLSPFILPEAKSEENMVHSYSQG